LPISEVGSRFDEDAVKLQEEVHMFSKIFGWVGAKLDDMSWGEFIFAIALVGGTCLVFTGMTMFEYHTQIAMR
jgi:hypothetical protein